MNVLTPTDIERKLNDRLNVALRLYQTLNTDEDTEIYNIIYFKLYFDFSTAIERTIHDIMVTKYGNDDFIVQKAKIDSRSVSNYLSRDEIKLLIKDFGSEITVNDIKNRFDFLGDIVPESHYLRLGLDRKVLEIETYTSVYSASKNTRNKIAHGLTLEQVEYNQKMLFNFMVSYYVLIEFYKTL